MYRLINITLFFLLLSINVSFAQVKLIFDTDFGGDADDLGAVAMLHYFIDQGECDLLAIMSWSTEQSVIPALDAVNRYYGHHEIPLGVRKDDTHQVDWAHSKPIADAFPNEQTYDSVEETTQLYRKILAQAEDHSIVIVTVGPLKNIQRLIESEKDEFSKLSGKKLIQKKVKEFVVMGGQFPTGEKEWNFDGGMVGVTQFVLEKLKVPVTFSGYEMGEAIKTGAVFNDLPRNTPLYTGFYHFSAHAPWMKANFKGEILDNSTFDQIAVLYAVRNGVGEWWDRIKNGYCQADEKGGNQWVNGKKFAHSYLKLTEEPEKMAAIIEAMMLHK